MVAVQQSRSHSCGRQQCSCVPSRAQSPLTLCWVPELDRGQLTSRGFPNGAAPGSSEQPVECNQPLMARRANTLVGALGPWHSCDFHTRWARGGGQEVCGALEELQAALALRGGLQGKG